LQPLNVRDAELRRKIPLQELNGIPGSGPLPVGMLLFTVYKENSRLPKASSPGNGVLALLANSLSARVRPAPTVATLVTALGAAKVLGGARGEARQLVEAVLAAWNNAQTSLDRG
jgi:hypothetical protein